MLLLGSFDWPMKIGLAIAVVGFAAITIFMFYVEGSSPRAIRAQAALEHEFQSIPSLPNSTPHDYGAGHKGQHALVGAKYVTLHTYQEIRNYYNDQLTTHGWQFANASSDGKNVYYRKGDFVAHLDYEAADPSYGFTYELNLTWGTDY